MISTAFVIWGGLDGFDCRNATIALLQVITAHIIITMHTMMQSHQSHKDKLGWMWKCMTHIHHVAGTMKRRIKFPLCKQISRLFRFEKYETWHWGANHWSWSAAGSFPMASQMWQHILLLYYEHLNCSSASWDVTPQKSSLTSYRPWKPLPGYWQIRAVHVLGSTWLLLLAGPLENGKTKTSGRQQGFLFKISAIETSSWITKWIQLSCGK